MNAVEVVAASLARGVGRAAPCPCHDVPQAVAAVEALDAFGLFGSVSLARAEGRDSGSRRQRAADLRVLAGTLDRLNDPGVPGVRFDPSRFERSALLAAVAAAFVDLEVGVDPVEALHAAADAVERLGGEPEPEPEHEHEAEHEPDRRLEPDVDATHGGVDACCSCGATPGEWHAADCPVFAELVAQPEPDQLEPEVTSIGSALRSLADADELLSARCTDLGDRLAELRTFAVHTALHPAGGPCGCATCRNVAAAAR